MRVVRFSHSSIGLCLGAPSRDFRAIYECGVVSGRIGATGKLRSQSRCVCIEDSNVGAPGLMLCNGAFGCDYGKVLTTSRKLFVGPWHWQFKQLARLFSPHLNQWK